jgi:hypothetical protein
MPCPGRSAYLSAGRGFPGLRGSETAGYLRVKGGLTAPEAGRCSALLAALGSCHARPRASMDGKPCQPRHRARRVADRRSLMNRSPAGPSTPSVRDDEGRARKQDRGRKRSRLFMPLRWLRGKLSSAVSWVRAEIKSLFMATIGKDRGFGFWWLVVTVAIALTIGLLVAVLVSPVIGILAALIVGIWMLVRRSRSSQSRKTVSRRSCELSVGLIAG